MAGIIERYLIKEVVAAWAAVAVVLLLILTSSYIGRFLADIAAGEVPADLLFSLLTLKTVGALGLLLPAALFIAAMLALGRLYRDSEMVVMSACGIGPARIYRALALLAVPAFVAMAVLTLWLAPRAAATGEALRDDAARNAQVSTLQSGRFQPLSGGRVIYVGEEAGGDRPFQRLLILGGEGEQVDVVTASTGRYLEDPGSGERFVVLEAGHRAVGVPGRADFSLLDFDRNTVRLPEPGGKRTMLSLEARPTAQLLREDTPYALAELHWRVAQALSIPVLILLVVPASRVAPRESRYSKLVLGFLIYLAYANTLGLGRAWIEQERLPATLGLWWVHALFAALALAWVSWQYRRNRVPSGAPA